MAPPRERPLTIVIDAPRSAPWNMARDEGLLDGERTVLRRTAWREPAVTIGRFQPWSILSHPLPPPDGSPVVPVRRLTGGGAIFPGEGLPRAWVAPRPPPLFPDRSPAAIARRAAELWLPALLPHHPGGRIRGGPSEERAQRSVVDCFDRRNPFDLVIEESGGEVRKIGGIAMHRRGDRVLIQASLLRSATMAPEGDRELLHALAAGSGLPIQEESEISPRELELSINAAALRYGRASWNRRAPASDRPAD
ncbi:MAG: hypothetical protein ACO4B4_11505 [Planctomycetota bacterium]